MELYTSETITDTTNSSTNNELSLSFDIANGGTETVYVDDKLLTNYDVAKARAESIFLEEGYVTKRVTFSTYHIDNLHIGDTIQLDGLLFKVINIVDKIKGAVVSMDITAERAKTDVYAYDEILVVSSTLTSSQIFSLCEFNGYIFAGTGSLGKIYKSQMGTDVWIEVFDHPTEYWIYKICSHNGFIFAGTGTSAGEIYRSADGESWELVYTLGGIIRAMSSHSDGYLYISKDDDIYRSINGDTWSLSASSIGTLVFDLYSHTDGYIYASSSGVLYRSIDGTSWTIVYTFVEPYLTGFIYHLGSYYVSTYAPAKIYKSADLTTWSEVYSSATDDYIWRMLSHTNGKIYAGGGDYDSSVIVSEDGVSWSNVAGILEETIQDIYQSSDGRLYIGTSAGGKIFADNKVLIGTE